MTVTIGRRELLAALGGAAVAWPLAARAQQLQRVRRIGILMGVADDAETKGWLVTFNQRLEQLGWQAGRNLQIRRTLDWWRSRANPALRRRTFGDTPGRGFRL
jgi:putative ABC transport system substrate-binding protein